MTIKKIVATYDYCDERGTLLYQKVRYDPRGFSQRRPDGRGWINNLDGTRPVLYRLHELQGCQEVVLCEGEKDADRLLSLGIPATTTSGGAKRQRGKNWRPEYTQQLIAAGVERLAAMPDNDDAGRVYATDAATACHAAGVNTKMVALPDVQPKGDVSDWLDAGHTKDELVALLRAAPADEPEAAGHAEGARDDRVEKTDAERPARKPRRRTAPSWPSALAQAALRGIFGDIVRLVAPPHRGRPRRVTPPDPGGLRQHHRSASLLHGGRDPPLHELVRADSRRHREVAKGHQPARDLSLLSSVGRDLGIRQLNRQVALKILPDAFAADPDRLGRFTREAQILASLNPRISPPLRKPRGRGRWCWSLLRGRPSLTALRRGRSRWRSRLPRRWRRRTRPGSSIGI